MYNIILTNVANNSIYSGTYEKSVGQGFYYYPIFEDVSLILGFGAY